MEEKKLKKQFETKTVEETVSLLKTNTSSGLSEEEAKVRLEKYGKNELKEKEKDSWIKIFLSQLRDPMIYILFAAIIVTIIVSIYDTVKNARAGNSFDFLKVGDWPDVIIIMAVIIINACIGTIQEIKAETSLEALKKMSSPEATVIRENKRYKIKASLLVPGDLVVLEEGDTIGADLRLVEAVNLKCTESSLTGESVPVEKDETITFSDNVGIGDKVNIAFMSTTVAYGRGLGIVVNTGMDTEIGKIADALEDASDEETPLQIVLDKLSKFLGILTLGIVILVLLAEIVWIFIDKNQGNADSWIEAVLSAISLAVAAVPEGLSAVVTIVLSIGVQQMVKVNTIVRKLPSVETLGAVSVVCSDKTGTLTQNKMTVVEAYVDNTFFKENDFNNKQENKELKLLASGMSLCSNATYDEGEFGDPTEIALVVMANRFDMHKAKLEAMQPRVDELPFDSVRKMMSTKHIVDGNPIIYTKGALDSILSRTTHILENGSVRTINEADIENINKANQYFADNALRALALAYTNKENIDENDLVFVGLVAMIDPAREEAKPAVQTFKNAGITTIMITGDHKDTAYAIAKNLGIVETRDQCYTGADVDAMTPEQLQETVKTARVFARVSPENKVQIVKAFQANGHICAMTGDGVNDAPSLKQANIGIAMGITGTDVAKGAADMVLADDNFASIEKAVEEGRSIYSNIKKTVLFLLSSNIAEVLVMLLLIIIGLPAPLIAIHLLWVNLVTDSLPAIALGMQPKEEGIMDEAPRNPNESIFAHGGKAIVFGYGAILTIGVILAYFIPGWTNGAHSISEVKALYEANSNILNQARTMAFTALALGELTHMLGMTDVKHSFVHIFKERNKMLWIALALGIVLQLLVIEIPGVRAVFSTENLTASEWAWTAIFAFIPLLLHEIIVLILYILKKKEK
ncbi:MAG: cation-translocating P-type ATPase [Acholeplasmatales bacterium]|nr:cation-translocating P-type ATPase [Acholeplasmatales bacterium]